MELEKGKSSRFYDPILDSIASWKHLQLILILVSLFAGIFFVYPPALLRFQFVKSTYEQHDEISHHLFAVFMELCLVLFVVEVLLRKHEKQKSEADRRNQLRLIKSAMFRRQLRDLYIANFQVLKKDSGISLKALQVSDLKPQMEEWGRQDSDYYKRFFNYDEKAKVRRVLAEYAKAENAWDKLEEIALSIGRDDVLDDITNVKNLIADYKNIVPDNSIGEVDQDVQKILDDPVKFERLICVWSRGMEKFVQYACELKGVEINKAEKKEKRNLFSTMMREYVEREQVVGENWSKEERQSKMAKEGEALNKEGDWMKIRALMIEVIEEHGKVR
ncbi:MAG: hypothetical protein OEV08_06045 [Nitrospira sp.]|nr:hypothetical protein [Nitrospira sp.]